MATVRRHLGAMLGDGPSRQRRLPTERALAAALGLPRSAVRDALSVLEAEGRITRLVGSGTYALPAAGDRAGPADGAGPGDASPGDASPAEIMEARLLLEPRLALLVAANAKAADFARMEECCREAEAATGLAAFEAWDAALHRAIALATHNRLLIDAYAAISAAREQADWGALKRSTATPERRARYCQEHRAIVAALKTRDAAAAEAAITAHLLAVRHNLLGA
ncbi:MAG: FCD domain-containing protein [Thalassobaculales bacterium]